MIYARLVLLALQGARSFFRSSWARLGSKIISCDIARARLGSKISSLGSLELEKFMLVPNTSIQYSPLKF